MPQRIQRRRSKGWRLPEGAVSVARPSRFGNPFRIVAGNVGEGRARANRVVVGPPWDTALDWHLGIGAMGEEIAYPTTGSDPNEHVVELYRRLLSERTVMWGDERFAAWIAPIAGHDLACFCPLGQQCHADVLLELANLTATTE